MTAFPHPVCISIGANDSCGSTGIQADIKTYMALNCYGAAAVTAVLAQPLEAAACQVRACAAIPPEQVRMQLAAIADSLPIGAIKVGYLPDPAVVRVVAAWLKAQPGRPVVIDPIILTNHGVPLADPALIQAVCSELLPLGTLATPNRQEAALLAGLDECLDLADMQEAATRLLKRYGCPVLVTGGGLGGRHLDLLAALDGISHFESPTVSRAKVSGTGCAFSAAVAASLAKGDSLREAILDAKAFVTGAIHAAPVLPNGRGVVWHGITVREQVLAEVSAMNLGLSAAGSGPARASPC